VSIGKEIAVPNSFLHRADTAGGTISYWYQADGLLTREMPAGEYYQFGHDDNGLLIYRASPVDHLAAVQQDD